MNRNDYTIVIGVKERELADDVVKSLHPLQTYILLGKDYPSFSKLVNDTIVLCPTEIMIFCSHRVRPTPNDIKTLLARIDQGYGLATLYRLGCFALKKELVRRIGAFDERYLLGGWEDNDIYLRLQEADIAYYEDESIGYIKGQSTWQHPPNKPLVSRTHYENKWHINQSLRTITRKLEETTTYDLGASNPSVQFKPWSESRLLSFSGWQNNYIFTTKQQEIVNKRILVFGGTGSLGHKIVDIYGNNNNITIFSRDENKHWHMGMKYSNLQFIIGDIRDAKRVTDAVLRTEPDIVIIASALKHVDKCEYEVGEALATNFTGALNVIDAITTHHKSLPTLSRVVFVSTDKACSPVNTYGLSKALAEKIGRAHV